jgi:class 3 adenylate cyclase
MVIDAQSQALAKEKDKTDRLLSNILPASIATRLRDGEVAIADEYPAVSILFADIVAFTPLAARLPPTEVVDLLSSLFTTFDELVAERGLEKIKTMGDSYMAAVDCQPRSTITPSAPWTSAWPSFVPPRSRAPSATDPRYPFESASTPGQSWGESLAGVSSPSTCGATR